MLGYIIIIHYPKAWFQKHIFGKNSHGQINPCGNKRMTPNVRSQHNSWPIWNMYSLKLLFSTNTPVGISCPQTFITVVRYALEIVQRIWLRFSLQQHRRPTTLLTMCPVTYKCLPFVPTHIQMCTYYYIWRALGVECVATWQHGYARACGTKVS